MENLFINATVKDYYELLNSSYIDELTFLEEVYIKDCNKYNTTTLGYVAILRGEVKYYYFWHNPTIRIYEIDITNVGKNTFYDIKECLSSKLRDKLFSDDCSIVNKYLKNVFVVEINDNYISLLVNYTLMIFEKDDELYETFMEAYNIEIIKNSLL